MRASSFVRLPTLSFAALACVAVFGGCKHEPSPGSLVVNYVLGNSKTCAELGIDRLEVRVYQGTLEEPSVEFTEEEVCNDDGELVVEGIDPGVYTIAVTGYDDSFVAIFDNQGQPAAERVIEIFDDAQATNDAELTARPAELLIAWRLGAGGFANCSGVGIASFDVVAYEVGGGTVLLEHNFDCEETGDAMGFRQMPDPDRLLNGTRLGEVGIQALDAGGNDVGAQAPFTFTPVGPGYKVELRIECTDMGCYEQP